MQSPKEAIVQLLLERGPFPDGVDVDSYCFLQVGHIDSMGLIKFVFRLEDTFGIAFSSDDIDSDDFQTVAGLARLIQSKMRY